MQWERPSPMHNAVLQSKFRLEAIVNHATAIEVLNSPSTKIVLAFTPWAATTKKELPLKEFIQRGGTLLCCGQFSSCITPSKAGDFFERMGFPWKFGSYCRTEDQLNRTRTTALFSNLPEIFSNKATRLTNVAFNDIMYFPADGAVVQSNVFSPTSMKGCEEASVALGKPPGGKGYLGYFGDVNDEEESAEVVMRICEGLLLR
jgi:hypothetical protein